MTDDKNPTRSPSSRQSSAVTPLFVVEDDPFTRLIQIVLDPSVPAARVAAFSHFFPNGVPDFPGWCSKLQARLETIRPARVEMVDGQEALAAAMPDAAVAVVESLTIGPRELERARALRVVQKFGTVTGGIDVRACEGRGI